MPPPPPPPCSAKRQVLDDEVRSNCIQGLQNLTAVAVTVSAAERCLHRRRRQNLSETNECLVNRGDLAKRAADDFCGKGGKCPPSEAHSSEQTAQYPGRWLSRAATDMLDVVLHCFTSLGVHACLMFTIHLVDKAHAQAQRLPRGGGEAPARRLQPPVRRLPPRLPLHRRQRACHPTACACESFMLGVS